MAAILMGSSLAFTGCGTKKAEPEQPRQVYGVADLETLVKSHPKYSEYFRQETEYNHLLEQYKNEQKRVIQIASQQAKIRAAVQDQSMRVAAENELKTRVKAKEDELNKQLQALYAEISSKHGVSGSVGSFDNLTPEERARMANLQMKLTVLGVTGDEKEQIKKELHELLNARSGKNDLPMAGWTAEEVKRMTDAKEKGSAELEAYANAQAAEIKAELDKKREASLQQFETAGNIGDPATFNAEWKEKLDAKQKEMASVKEEIMDDIRKEAGRVASEKNLAMIFTKYRVNVNASDVTGEIAGRIINISK